MFKSIKKMFKSIKSIKSINSINCEKWYPLVISVLITLVAFIALPPEIKVSENFDNFLAAVITFGSIILGFLGVVLSILLSIRNTELVEYIFRSVSREILKGYFKKPIIAGFFAIIVVISLYFFDSYSSVAIIISKNLNITLGKCVISLGIFLNSYFMISSYRIIDIMMYIIFKEPEATENMPRGKKIDPVREQELKEKYKRKK